LIPLTWYLYVAALVFAIGLYAVTRRQNVIMMLIGIELMLNAANINLVAFSYYRGDMGGLTLAVISIAVAAAELAVGLAIAIIVFKNFKTINTSQLTNLKG
jgi:NADH:ubiquinone oxidoreductase subunit K